MEEEPTDDRRRFGWGLGASLLLHGLAALMLIGGVSGHVTQPLTDTVEVELVPPPQAETQPEQPQPEQPETQEAETPPPPEQTEQPQEEEAAPPPPPPPPAAEAETQKPPAEALVQEEVTEFGEEDTGQQGEDDVPPAASAGAEGTAEQPGETEGGPEGPGSGPETVETAEQDVPEDTSHETAEEEAQPEETPEDAPAEVANLEADAETEPEEASGTEAETDTGLGAEIPAEDFGVVGPIATDKTPSPKPARRTASAERQEPSRQPGGGGGETGGPPAGMLAARELFTREILDDPQARTAMGEMSPGQRLNFLCMTELRAQISSVSALPPELLPSFRPRGGTVLQPQNAAFRSLGRWFDVNFRCETDEEVKRVEKFSFKIGKEIPPSQWGQRGLSGF
ncbi:DUF930 domain-containing protein [Roseibium sp. M-1]